MEAGSGEIPDIVKEHQYSSPRYEYLPTETAWPCHGCLHKPWSFGRSFALW